MTRVLLALALLAGCSDAAEPPLAGAVEPVYAGNPVTAAAGDAPLVLDNPGFRIGYSDERRQPLWVAFRAQSVQGRPRIGPRPEQFSPDPRVPHPVTSGDYAGTKRGIHYTRGHLAPNYLIGKLHGRDGQLATFRMSNVSPQARRLNSLAWQRIEEAEVDIVAPALGELWVITGPVFGPSPKMLRKTDIAIPQAFYRIWLDVLPSGSPRALAFIVPQDVCGTEPLSRFLTTVDQIEQRTGLDFHAALDDDIENPMERARDTDGWSFRRIDTRAPRYGEKFEGQECEAGVTAAQ